MSLPRLAPWLALLSWAGLSLAWSPAPGRGIAGLAGWVLALLWTVLLLNLGDDPRFKRRYAAVALVAGLACAALALLQRAGIGPRLGLHVITGTVGNPNQLACALLLLLPLTRWLIRSSTSRRTHALGWAAAALLCTAIAATRCQGAMLGLVGVWAYWIATSRWSRRRRVAALLALALIGAALWTHPGWRSAFSAGLSGRLHLARVSAGVIAEHPLRGVGLGGYASAAAPVQGALLQDHRGPGLWTNLRDAHNLGLMTLAELGPLGLAALLWLVLPPLIRCHRRRGRDPAAGEAVAAWIGLALCGLTEAPLQAPLPLLLAFGWLALGGGWRATPQAAPRGALIAVALLGASQAATTAWADLQLGRGLAAEAALTAQTPRPAQRRRLQQAERHYSRGLLPLVDPAELLLSRALIRRQLGRYADATRDGQRSFDLLPTPERALFLGDLAAERGELDAARGWYRRAIALHPRYTRAYNNLGVALLRAGDPRQARRYLRRALSLRPYDLAIRANWRLVQRDGPI